MVKKKIDNSFLALAFIFIFGFILFVTAAHTVTTSSGDSSYNINEDVGNHYNITVNNTDSGQDANITQVNITIPSSFTFTGLNGTDATNTAVFTNTSTVLSWSNLSDYIINGSEAKHFWFNATASTPGTYNITIFSTNATGTEMTNISVTVNDTTVPAVTINYPSSLSNYSGGSINFNITAIDVINVSACRYTLNSGTTNTTMTANSSSTGFNATNSSIADGTYTVAFYCNDTSNNINHTETVTFGTDNTFPTIDYGTGTETNGTNASRSNIYVNVSITESTEDTITFLLHNSTGQANSTSYTDATRVINWTSLADGAYTFNVTINDSAGNSNVTGTRTFTLDTTAPAVTITLPETNGTTFYETSTINFNITVIDAISSVDSCWYTLNSGTTNTTMTANSSSTGFNATNSSIADGTYVSVFYCNDTLNNLNGTESLTFTIDSDAWVFNGTTYDINGNALNNTLINLTYWAFGATGPSLVGSTSTNANASGWFELNATGNSSYMYRPVITRTNATTSAVDYVGQSLPQFPYSEFANTSGMSFYLKQAGTINITALNSTGTGRTVFNYMVKDTKLGYDIASSFSTYVTEKIIYVPADRNYSIMIYPNQSMPVSFNWNNFTSSSDYDIDALSTYNKTTKTVQKQFNTTTNYVRVTGYIQNTSNNDFADWNEFTVIPYLLEPGDMVYLGQGGLPYNMSSWNNGQTDVYNLTSGWYNITLPGPAEGGNYILFATARNGSAYYGGYKNISTSYGTGPGETNFTMYSLMSTNWATSTGNITMNRATDWSEINISSAKQGFALVNSTNSTISNTQFHIETTVDYSSYGAKEFTFMEDITSSGNATFYLPLINNTGIKEINVYSMSYAPKRVSTMTAAQILANSNITMTTFNPQALDGTTGSSISIALYKSNSTCDVPAPDSSACLIGDASNMENFNPLSAIIGGGALSFRMGMGGVLVHYVNVDMLASGPPDALFEDNNDITESTSGGFDKAMRFGSNGPTIYDYVLVSLPYTQGVAGSQSGLDENSDINVTIPLLYDDSWNIIWNASTNGTNASALSGNYSHYTTYQEDWETLMTSNNCTRNVSLFNATLPCYADTTNNRIWVRLPHFSGTNADVDGTSIEYSSSSSSSSSGGGGGGGVTLSPGEEELNQGYEKVLQKNWKMLFKINEDSHTLTVGEITSATAKVVVSSDPQEAILSIGQVKKFELSGDNFYDLLVKLNSINTIGIYSANFTIQTIYEDITTTPQDEEGSEKTGTEEKWPETGVSEGSKTSLWWIWILLVVIIIAVFFGIRYKKSKSKRHKLYWENLKKKIE